MKFSCWETYRMENKQRKCQSITPLFYGQLSSCVDSVWVFVVIIVPPATYAEVWDI